MTDNGQPGGWGTPPPYGATPPTLYGTPAPAPQPSASGWGTAPTPAAWTPPPPLRPPPPPARRSPSKRVLYAGAGLLLLLGGATAAVLAQGPHTAAVAAPTPSPAPVSAAPETSAEATPDPTPTVQAQSAGAAGEALAALVVAESGSTADYDRTAFGAAWTDTDRNGCDTRNDVLARDLTNVTLRPGTQDCVVVSGSLVDPYSGATLPYGPGEASIQVDHVVALDDAWRTGASTWPYAKLLAFANDPLELLAVDGSLNEAKSDSDAAGWLPPTNVCAYAARQVAVKQKYLLTVTQEEHDALLTALATCPEQVLPSGGNPTLAPNRSPAPTAPRPAATTPQPAVQGFTGSGTPASAGDPDYGTCKNAKAHGGGPYYEGKDPEYHYYQDRDHDGIVCE